MELQLLISYWGEFIAGHLGQMQLRKRLRRPCLCPLHWRHWQIIVPITLEHHKRPSTRVPKYSNQIPFQGLAMTVSSITRVLVDVATRKAYRSFWSIAWAFLEQLALAAIDIGRLDVADVGDSYLSAVWALMLSRAAWNDSRKSFLNHPA